MAATRTQERDERKRAKGARAEKETRGSAQLSVYTSLEEVECSFGLLVVMQKCVVMLAWRCLPACLYWVMG